MQKDASANPTVTDKEGPPQNSVIIPEGKGDSTMHEVPPEKAEPSVEAEDKPVAAPPQDAEGDVKMEG